jgi:hypothetical protein
MPQRFQEGMLGIFVHNRAETQGAGPMDRLPAICAVAIC